VRRKKQYFQNVLKTPEPELSTNNTVHICSCGEEMIKPPPVVEEVESAVEN
jgi:hypothetical protein